MAGVTTVCTGWHPAAWGEYARRFSETFNLHWSAEVHFVSFIELISYQETLALLPRGHAALLWDIPGAREFVERHKGIPAHCGAKGWRWDALRWFKQCIISHYVAQELDDGDILVWLDADVVTFADVPPAFVEGLLGDADLCYLGRRTHSEIGFWAVRLNARSRWFLGELSALYLDDRVFALPETHSAYAFDVARVAAQQIRGLVARDLTPGGHGHVWLRSPLMPFLDHCKGKRKAIGHSPEHPLRWWTKR